MTSFAIGMCLGFLGIGYIWGLIMGYSASEELKQQLGDALHQKNIWQAQANEYLRQMVAHDCTEWRKRMGIKA